MTRNDIDIEIHDGKFVRVNDVVYLMFENPYTKEEDLTTGRVKSIIFPETGHDFVEVSVRFFNPEDHPLIFRTVVISCFPSSLFSTEKALIKNHISVLLERVNSASKYSEELGKMIEANENKMEANLNKINELKKMIR